jgi:hypothetical protein
MQRVHEVLLFAPDNFPDLRHRALAVDHTADLRVHVAHQSQQFFAFRVRLVGAELHDGQNVVPHPHREGDNRFQPDLHGRGFPLGKQQRDRLLIVHPRMLAIGEHVAGKTLPACVAHLLRGGMKRGETRVGGVADGRDQLVGRFGRR